MRQPFAIATVKQQNLGPVFHAQHIGEIVELVRIGSNGRSRLKRSVDEQALQAKIGAPGLQMMKGDRTR